MEYQSKFESNSCVRGTREYSLGEKFMSRIRVVKAVAFGVVLALGAAACGSDDSGSDSGSAATAATVAAADGQAGDAQGENTAADGPGSAESVLSAENIASVFASYDGPLADFPETFGVPEAEGGLVIGWSSANDSNELVSRLGRAIEAEVLKTGNTFKTLDAAADVGQQVSQMQQFVNEGVDAIVVWPLDATALLPTIGLAAEAGIPVMAMEASPDGGGDLGDIAGQVLYGRDMQAYVAANLMAQLEPAGQIGVASFAVPVPSVVYYAERVVFHAGEAGLDVVGTVDNPSDDVAGGASVAGPLLAGNPDLVGVIAYNDPTAIGAQTAARAASREIIAFGANGESAGVDAVRGGTTSLTIQPPIVRWAEELVGGAVLAQAGSTIPPVVFVGPGNFVTSANIDDALTLDQLIDNHYGS